MVAHIQYKHCYSLTLTVAKRVIGLGLGGLVTSMYGYRSGSPWFDSPVEPRLITVMSFLLRHSQ